jgi:RNA polymerase sigma factor (sigma-70 family)
MTKAALLHGTNLYFCNELLLYSQMKTDRELLDAMAKKDRNAFEVFYKRYARLLQMWALRYTGNKVLTEDIAQNFWIIVWTSPHLFKTNDEGVAKDYLLRYFTYRMLDYIKSAGAQVLGNELKLTEATQTLSYTHVFEELETREIHTLINQVLREMPELTREIFRLMWDNNTSVKETAIQLEVSEKVVRSNYNKTIQAIRQQLLELQSEDKTGLQPETLLLLLILLGLNK